MIKFQLKDWSDIAVFGSAEKGYYLPWFSCTDAYYCFQFAGHELFRYSDRYVDINRERMKSPYVGYFLARLVEDLAEILPAVLTSIPDHIFSHIQTISDMKKLECLSHEWYQEQDVDEMPAEYAYDWVYDRQINTGYLRGGPRIYFFRRFDHIVTRWICDFEEDGIKMWQEIEGELTICFKDFLNDLADFYRQFWDQMDRHLEDLIKNYARPDVLVDADRLRKEHSQRQKQVDQLLSLLSSGKLTKQTNWSVVEQEINKVLDGRM